MLVTPVEATLTLPVSHGRSPGVHLSAIIRCIAAETGVLKPQWVESIEELTLEDTPLTDPGVITRVCIGLAWEAWYITTQLPHVVDHPGEMTLDGIHMTPDGEGIETIVVEKKARDVLAIHEIKATYKSLKTLAPQQVTGNPNDPSDLSSQWMWMAQLKGYCKAAGTRIGYLHALLVCGDYSYPLSPMLRVWRIEFTQQELDDHWELITDYRDHKLRLQAEGDE